MNRESSFASGEQRPALPRTVLLRFLLLVILVVGGFLILTRTPIADHLTREQLLTTLGELRSAWWSPLMLIGLFAVVSPLGAPVSPLVVAAGAVFGTALGTLYNTAGLFVGAGTSYLMARFLGRDFVAHFAGSRLRRAERVLHRQGFWPLVQVRFMPLPFSVVNYGAALAGIPILRFLAASLIGLAPATLMHTFFVATLLRTPKEKQLPVLALYLATWAGLAAVSGFSSARGWWRRRQRYRNLLEQRRSAGRDQRR